MLIIQREALEENFHPFQSQSHKTQCWLSGWIEVPKTLEQVTLATGGYCDLLIEGDVLQNVIPREQPQREDLVTEAEALLILMGGV